MKVPFQTVDVFTDRQFGGNPAAVIPDARAFRTLKCRPSPMSSILLRQRLFCLRTILGIPLAYVFSRLALRCRLRAILTLALRLSWRTTTQFAAPVLTVGT